MDLEKLEGKKKNLESNFLSIVWFEESQKEQKLRGKMQENFELLWKKKFFLPNMREK